MANVPCRRARLMDGIPEMYIPQMEPLVVPEVKMDQNSGAIYLLQLEPSKLKFIVSMTFPELRMEAEYSSSVVDARV